jgi:catechol 2,3-dioxygenase-like lactoylglutathione lyase family enzyme
MQRVKGIGGVFFKAQEPGTLQAWYVEHLGLDPENTGMVSLEWRDKDDPDRIGQTVWSPFPQDTEYFGPGQTSWMINYRVDDLDAMLAQLRAAGVQVDDHVENTEYGRFGWATDPEGHRFELWQPAEGS